MTTKIPEGAVRVNIVETPSLKPITNRVYYYQCNFYIESNGEVLVVPKNQLEETINRMFPVEGGLLVTEYTPEKRKSLEEVEEKIEEIWRKEDGWLDVRVSDNCPRCETPLIAKVTEEEVFLQCIGCGWRVIGSDLLLSTGKVIFEIKAPCKEEKKGEKEARRSEYLEEKEAELAVDRLEERRREMRYHETYSDLEYM